MISDIEQQGRNQEDMNGIDPGIGGFRMKAKKELVAMIEKDHPADGQ